MSLRGFHAHRQDGLARSEPWTPAVPLRKLDGLFYRSSRWAANQWQNAHGDTRVAATGDPVGLLLDENHSLGPELVSNKTFDDLTGWTNVSGKWSTSGGVATVAGMTTAGDDQLVLDGVTVEAGELYMITWTVTARSAGGIGVKIGSTSGQARVGTGTWTEFIRAGGTGAPRFERRANDFTGSVDNISIRKVTGHHAEQSTSPARPTLQSDPWHWRLDGTDDFLSVTRSSGSWSSNMYICFALRTSDTKFLTIANSSGDYLFAANAADPATTLSANAGTPTLKKNGSVFSGTTRDDVHAFLSVGSWIVVEMTGVDLSSANWDSFFIGKFSAATWELLGDIANFTMLDAPSAALQAQVLNWTAAPVGVSL